MVSIHHTCAEYPGGAAGMKLGGLLPAAFRRGAEKRRSIRRQCPRAVLSRLGMHAPGPLILPASDWRTVLETQRGQLGQMTRAVVVDANRRPSPNDFVYRRASGRRQMETLLQPHLSPGKTDQEDLPPVPARPVVLNHGFLRGRLPRRFRCQHGEFSAGLGDVLLPPLRNSIQPSRRVFRPPMQTVLAIPSRCPDYAPSKDDLAAASFLLQLACRQTIADPKDRSRAAVRAL
ncbi:MAG: hypothetical protein IANPNBLG_03754 [Bryobacteraceae bacterium]|nr:hypothetical protein [Bryobacteraceae bacterium]